MKKFDRATEEFVVYQSDEDNPNSLIGNDIYDIIEDDAGALWIATWDGLDKFYPQTETVVHYQHDDNNPNSLSHNNLNALYYDKSGLLWIAIWGYGLDKFDPQSETYVHYEHDDKNPQSLSHDHINMIYEDRKGILWFGTVGLHYVYEDNSENREAESEEVIKIKDIKSELAKLPADLLIALQQVIETADIQAMESLFKQINDKPLAKTLTKLAKGFRFDILQEVFEE